ncbi:MAG: hypothetical protein AABW83_04105 [Nanoarchaeota archaeon]
MFLNKKIKRAIFRRPYSFYFIFLFFLFLFSDIWINKLYITYRVLIEKSYYGILFIFLILTIAFLTSLNINLIIIKFKEFKKINYNSGGFTTLGIFFGVLGGACPGCIVGLFPAVTGIFLGTGASLNLLPFKGIELQILSVILLVISAKLLSKNNVCKI